ncbi:hypothetical protein [Roseibacillus ishigakijimensis]|uniref:Uncharacterized protein n=1 Tax=Roseibacillus ishigakijimensis TaxID=454146 RepID=A0A934RP89_9BACT|nr:hypothetical protein [Roseibacillus ishigakijimensis]MBK1832963.1 hypothetical protein [Roseibacillus ishigakijimensis]
MTRSLPALRWAAWGLGFVVLLVLALLLAVERFFSPAYLEGWLARELNARVTLGGREVNLWSREVVLEDLALEPREELAGPTWIRVGEARLGVRLLPLFSRRLEVTGLTVVEPEVAMTFAEGGGLTLRELFRQPEDVPNGGNGGEEQRGRDKPRVLPAEKNEWLARLEVLQLSEGAVQIHWQEEELTLAIEELVLTVEALEFEPANLSSLNNVALALQGEFTLTDGSGFPLLFLGLTGPVTGELFDPLSGEFDLRVATQLVLAEESYLDPRVAPVRKASQYVEKIWPGTPPWADEQFGFSRGRRLAGSYHRGIIRLAAPLSLEAGDWDLGLGAASWIDMGRGLHQFEVEFLAGEDLDGLLGGLWTALPAELREKAGARFSAEGKALWRIESRGELADPDFRFFNQIPPDLEQFLRLEGTLNDSLQELEGELDGVLRRFLDDL